MAHVVEKNRQDIGRQAGRLRELYPDAKCQITRHGTLVWIGEITPSALSRKYRIKIDYAPSFAIPKVYVLEPKIRMPQIKSKVHCYNDGTLCLYSFGQWDNTMLIAETIIPWTSEWFLFYEIWQVTGEWPA
jgi:hypothetical protein